MNHEEYKNHTAIVEHHRSAFPGTLLMYVPNSTRDGTEAFFNKQLGAQPGAHDLFIFWRKAFFNLIPWIGVGIYEVKSRVGKLSTPQNKFASTLKWMGAHTAYGSSVAHYHETLKSWGIKPAHEVIQEPDLRTKQQKFTDTLEYFRPEDVV